MILFINRKSCESGASASFYTAFKKKLVDNDVTFYFSKGFLNIKLENENILMTGQYSYVFNGYINIWDFLNLIKN